MSLPLPTLYLTYQPDYKQDQPSMQAFNFHFTKFIHPSVIDPARSDHRNFQFQMSVIPN